METSTGRSYFAPARAYGAQATEPELGQIPTGTAIDAHSATYMGNRDSHPRESSRVHQSLCQRRCSLERTRVPATTRRAHLGVWVDRGFFRAGI